MAEEQEFDKWNKQKKSLHLRKQRIIPYPQVGEVWMGIVGKNIGNEQNGGGNNFSRPILVVKRFNTQMFWVVPISSKQKSLNYYFNFTDPNGRSSTIILAQLKLASVKRFNRFIYILNKEQYETVINKLVKLLND